MRLTNDVMRIIPFNSDSDRIIEKVRFSSPSIAHTQDHTHGMAGTHHYDDVIMGTMASQITSLTFVYSTVYLGADQRKHQSSASLAFVWGIHRGPVNSLHKWPVTLKIFPFDDVIMLYILLSLRNGNPCRTSSWENKKPQRSCDVSLIETL